jgi:hypothetical protein
LRDPFLRAVEAARKDKTIPIDTPFGKMRGYSPIGVIKLVLEIIEYFLCVDVLGTMQLLIDIFRGETNNEIQHQIVNIARKLSAYNIDVYNQIGPGLQMALLDYLDKLKDGDLVVFRPIALAIWTEALRSEISGVKSEAKKIILYRGVVPYSPALQKVRSQAINALCKSYDHSANDLQKREVFSALDAAPWTPYQGKCSTELLNATLMDTTRIVEFMTERTPSTSYELKHQFLFEYYRAQASKEKKETPSDCRNNVEKLMEAIQKYRDDINSNELFTRYKVLVDHESVFFLQWTDREYRYKKAEEFRQGEIDRYLKEMCAENAEYWFNLLVRCLENGAMVFQYIGKLIENLAQHKPEIAFGFLVHPSKGLQKFLPGFLNGLVKSDRPDIYEEAVRGVLNSGNDLAGLAHHLRYSSIKKPDFAKPLLMKAIEKDDLLAVNKCFLPGLYFC